MYDLRMHLCLMTLMTDAGRVNHQDLRSRQVVNAVPRDDIEYSTVLGRTSESGGAELLSCIS